MPAGLCHPGELQFAKPNLSNDEPFEQRAVNNILPCPYHPKLETVAPKHPAGALATAIHYQLHKWLFTKFTASQTEIADMFQVECKKFFSTITGHQYDTGKKPTKADKLRMLGSKTDTEPEKSEEPTQETEQTQSEPTETIDPDMPPLEDAAKQSCRRNLNINNLLTDHLDGSSLKKNNSLVYQLLLPTSNVTNVFTFSATVQYAYVVACPDIC